MIMAVLTMSVIKILRLLVQLNKYVRKYCLRLTIKQKLIVFFFYYYLKVFKINIYINLLMYFILLTQLSTQSTQSLRHI